MTTPLADHGTPWKLDESEIFKRLLETGTDPIEAITEFVQNAVDSILPPFEEIGQMTAEQAHLLSNEINLWFPDNRTNDIVFIGQDHGLSIAKDYDYDIHKKLGYMYLQKTKSPDEDTPSVYFIHYNEPPISLIKRRGRAVRFEYRRCTKDGKTYKTLDEVLTDNHGSKMSNERQPVTRRKEKYSKELDNKSRRLEDTPLSWHIDKSTNQFDWI